MSINSSPRTRAWTRIAVAVVFVIVAGIMAVALYGSPFDDNSQNETNNSDPTGAVSYPITDPDQFPNPDVALIAAQTNDSGLLTLVLPENLQGGMLSIYDQVEDADGNPNVRSYDCTVVVDNESSETCTARLYFDGYSWELFMLTIDGMPSLLGE